MGKRTNIDQQNITQKTTDRVMQTPLNTGGEHRCSGRVSSSCSICGTRYGTLATRTCYCFLNLLNLIIHVFNLHVFNLHVFNLHVFNLHVFNLHVFNLHAKLQVNISRKFNKSSSRRSRK
jgi:hypothetical protein